MTDNLQAARELVAKWRDAAEGSTDSPNPTVKAVARCHIELATELESALAQAPAVRVTGAHRYEESGRGWCKHCGYAAHVAEQHGAALGQGKES